MKNESSQFPSVNFETVARIRRDGLILEVIPDNFRTKTAAEELFVGKNVNQFAAPELTEKGLAIIHQVLETNIAQTFTQSFQIEGAGERIFDIKILCSSADEVMAIVRDITEKKKAEDALIKLNQTFISLQSASTSITSSLDNDYILNTFTWEMTNLLNAWGCIVYQWNPQDSTLSYMASYPPDEKGRLSETKKTFDIKENSATHSVLQEQQALQVAINQTNALLKDVFFATEQAYLRRKDLCTLLMLPLIFQNRTVGIIEIIEEDHLVFSDQEISIAQLLVNETAGAIVNAQLYSNLDRRLQDLAMLNEISQALSTTLDTEKTLEIIPAKVQGLIGAMAVSIALVQPDQTHIKFVSSTGSKAPYIQGRQLKLGEGIISWVIQNNKPLIVTDTQIDSRHYTAFDEETGFTTESLICVPLNTKGRAIGAITTINKLVGEFDQDDLRLLTSVAATASSAIENAQLYHRARTEIADRQRAEEALERERTLLAERIKERTAELNQQYQRQRAVAKIEPAINHPSELQGVLQQVVDVTETMLPSDGGVTIILYNKVQNDFRVAAISKNHPLENELKTNWKSSGASSQILNKKETYIVNDISQSVYPKSQTLQNSGLQSFVAIPLIGQGQGLGIIYVSSWEKREYSQKDLDFLYALSDRAAVAIANVQLYEALQSTNVELARIALMKDEFLAGMSHELRTPLNAILGISEGLQEQLYGPLNERQIRSMQIVEESGRHLLTIINDILDVSKIESGQLEMDLEPVQARFICESSIQFVKQSAIKKKISIKQDISQQVNVILTDARRLKQILINLLSNAVKFTPENGEVGLEVVGDATNKVVHFTVWDSGIGISEEALPQLFQPFVQLDSSLSRRFAGTGLGLVLVKRMTELQGGSVSVKSKMGQGSRFIISLPWQPETAVSPTESPERSEQSIIDTSTNVEKAYTILLAEDDQFNSEIFSQFLKMRGYTVLLAQNGKEVIKLCQSKMPDLILMDIQMPEMDGLEAIHKIRSQPDCKNLPIIALTALAMDGDKQRCLDAGANDYLSKPVPLQKLHQTIQDVLRN